MSGWIGGRLESSFHDAGPPALYRFGVIVAPYQGKGAGSVIEKEICSRCTEIFAASLLIVV